MLDNFMGGMYNRAELNNPGYSVVRATRWNYMDRTTFIIVVSVLSFVSLCLLVGLVILGLKARQAKKEAGSYTYVEPASN